MIPHSLLKDMNDSLDSGDAAARAALTARITDQPEAQAMWDALQGIEQKFNAAPLLSPQAGFAQRFETRRNATHDASGKTWLAFLSGVMLIGGGTAAAPVILDLLLNASEVLTNEFVFALIVRNTLESGITIVRALVTSGIALAEVAIPNPLMWVVMFGSILIVGAWVYLISKLTLEVSLT